MSHLDATCPLDGRYSAQLSSLKEFGFTERNLIQAKVDVEIGWVRQLLKTLANDDSGGEMFEAVVRSVPDLVERIVELDKVLRHDTKAVEVGIRDSIQSHELSISSFARAREFIHFGLTSEDITGSAYSIMFKRSWDGIYVPSGQKLTDQLISLVKAYKASPLMSRTHGQPATPTTFGKEIAVFLNRLQQLRFGVEFKACGPAYIKFGGAVGNFAALCSAYPSIDWIEIATEFVSRLDDDFTLDPATTQIPTREWMLQRLELIKLQCGVLLDLSRDMWSYIGNGLLKLRVVVSEVGSSTMPHKVNPLDFENAEGNFELAAGLINTLVAKLQVSRLQRDLSDSTVMRNIGMVFAYFTLACRSLSRGLGRISFDEKRAIEELELHYELLAEPIQTILRTYPDKVSDPYTLLKHFTRGKGNLSKSDLQEFLHEHVKPIVSAEDYDRLINLTPSSYIGLSAHIAANYVPNCDV